MAPQAAKTLSPQFPTMGGFGGGSSNSFVQMPTGAAPTSTSSANYSQMNARPSLNTNGYGRSCGYISNRVCVSVVCFTSFHLTVLSQTALSLQHSFLLAQRRRCGPSGKASSTPRITQSSILTLRATSKTCFLWVTQALSFSSLLSFFSSTLHPKYVSLCLVWCRMCCQCWTSLPTSTVTTLRFPSTLHLTSDLVQSTSYSFIFSSSAPLIFLLLRVHSPLHCHKLVKDGEMYLKGKSRICYWLQVNHFNNIPFYW